MTVARAYIRNCKCKPDIITPPITHLPKCESCGKYMVEGDEW